jgi:hypothetical protein
VGAKIAGVEGGLGGDLLGNFASHLVELLVF